MQADSIIKQKQFWRIYFIYRLIVYLFTIFVYARLTTLGDTSRYLQGAFASNFLYNSTAMMDSIGGVLGRITFHNMFLANFPFMILSYIVIKWAVEKTGIRTKMPSILLLMMLGLPNFCIWTTVYSKEFVGLVISAIFGVLFFRYFKGDFKLGFIDYLAIYLCLLFKPQYLPFICQGLIYIYIAKKFIRNAKGRAIFALIVIMLNVSVIIFISPLVNQLASMMYIHFGSYDGNSTRPNIFLQDGDFFRHLPTGMIIAFVGPTFREMISSPLMMIAGLEGLFMIGLFIWLSARVLKRLLDFGRLSPIPFFAILITTLGLLFIHYPFGIFNPGSAIRYRTNFLFLFMLLLSYLYIYPRIKNKKNENSVLR